MMLVWSAEHVTEITTELIDLEFLLTATNVERGGHKVEFVLQQTHTAPMALTNYEANDIVANSRKNPWEAWRRLQKRHFRTGGRMWNFLRTIFSPGRCSLLEHQARIERWESRVADDEIKLAGLEASVPEELEKHLTLNSNRLRSFEDARLEIGTYVEAKFGLRNRDNKPSDTASRGDSGAMDVAAINSLASGNGRGSSRIT